MIQIGFYCANKKGYKTLQSFIETYGAKYIKYISSYRNGNVNNDYYLEIKMLSKDSDVFFFDREEMPNNLIEDYKIAIGWQWVISDFKNLIVLHDSLLPKYRGFSPIVNMLINGEKEIGVTALFASEKYDEGGVILQEKLEINYPVKIQEVIDLSIVLYIKIVNKIFIKLNDKKITTISQDDNLSSYGVWLDEEDYFIDWSWSAEKIKRFVDAVGFPYKNARTNLEDEIILIKDVSLFDEKIVIENRSRHLGKVVFFRKNKPIIICGSGFIIMNSTSADIIKLKSRFK